MRRRFLTVSVTIGLISTLGLLSVSSQSPAAGFHVTICHRTGSATNPYILISPDVEGVVNGHLDHEQTGNGLGGDIIPEFFYNGTYYSKNLATVFGQGITGSQVLSAGCKIPKNITPSPTKTPPYTATPTPRPPPPGATPPAPVPEPMTILLFGTGLAGVGLAARRKLFPKK